MTRPNWLRISLWLLMLLVGGGLVHMARPTFAQELTQVPAPIVTQERAAEETQPPRQAQRAAPVRTPVVLQAGEDGGDGPAATAALIELPVAEDAYVASERPNTNFGGAALYVGYHNIDDPFGAERSLLRFDLSEIPGDVVIQEATVRLYMSFATPSDSNAMRIIVRQLNSDWSEYGVTWNGEPAWAAVRAETFVGTTEGWYEWDITDLVREWRSGVAPNFGIELIGDERIQLRERAFNSRETESNLYPRLIVRFDEQMDDQAPTVTVEPLDEFSPRNFTVRWSGADEGGSGIDFYDVQYRVNGGTWIEWINGTTDTSAEFTGGESGDFYEFRARGVDGADNSEEFRGPEAGTTVDVREPNSTVNPLPEYLQEETFTVSWQGSDEGGGIATFDVRYRRNGRAWVLWQHGVTDRSALFVAELDGLYEFEVRAVDEAGLFEPFRRSGEAQVLVDARPPFVVPCCWLPQIYE